MMKNNIIVIVIFIILSQFVRFLYILFLFFTCLRAKGMRRENVGDVEKRK